MKIFSLIASRFRPRILFKFLQAFHATPPFGHAAKLFDPNSIRRKIDFSFAEKLVTMGKGGYRLIVNVNDHIGYWTYVRQVPFEQSVYLMGKALKLGEGDVILDIGANIGVASVPICAETGCELIAVEASKYNAALLLRNAALNGIRMRAHVLALTSNKEAGGYLPLYIRNGNHGANSLIKEWAPSLGKAHCELVPTSTLDQLICDEALIDRIRIVKIDVEGAEKSVFEGGRAFLERNRAPIIMEYRLDAAKQYLGSDLSSLIEMLSEFYEPSGLLPSGQEIAFDPAVSYENIVLRRRAS